MQVITVTKDFLFSTQCTLEMLTEIAMHKDFIGMSQDAVTKLANQELRNGSTRKGSKSSASGDLPHAKLRTVIVQKLQDSPTVGETFKAGTMQFEMQCLPDMDINQAGANKQRSSSGGRAAAQELKGAYVRTDKLKNCKCTEASDPDKWAIWKFVWECNSFEEFFAKAPKKGHTKTGRPITAASEMRWAVNSGWVKPADQQQA